MVHVPCVTLWAAAILDIYLRTSDLRLHTTLIHIAQCSSIYGIGFGIQKLSNGLVSHT